MADKPHIVILAKAGAGWLGGRIYAINLIKALLAHRQTAAPFDISVLVRGEDELANYEPLRADLKTLASIESQLPANSPANRVRLRARRAFSGWVNPRFEQPLKEMGASFVYPFSSRVIPSADWISDFQFHHHPDRMSADEVSDRNVEFGAIVRDAQRVVLSSFDAQNDCLAVYPQTAGRTAVLQFRTFADPDWLAADPQSVREKYHLPERYALVSNWFLPTKNHRLIFQALAQIPPASRRGIHVVCTGDLYDSRNPGFYNRILADIHTLGVRDNVSLLGVIPKADQVQLLRGCSAYLQPSLFEGWNTGVEEARMLGRPILLSSIGVHREQSPPGAVFFDPGDAGDLAAKLTAAFDAPDQGRRAEIEASALADYGRLQARYGADFMSIANGGPGSASPTVPEY